MVLLFKGIAPPGQFPATITSRAAPKPNHAVLKAELMYVLKPFGGAGEGGGSAPRALRLFQKNSLRPLRAHNVHTYTSGTSCAGTRHMPFVGCFSLGSRNMGDGSGGAEGAKERRPYSATLGDDPSSHPLRWTHHLSDRLFSLWPEEERLAACKC